jgi:hypothetical protein
MIVSLILALIYGVILVITYPLRSFSDVVLDPNINAAISTAGNYLAIVNQIAPITTLIAILSIVLTIEVFIFIYKLIMWIIRKIPTIS